MVCVYFFTVTYCIRWHSLLKINYMYLMLMISNVSGLGWNYLCMKKKSLSLSYIYVCETMDRDVKRWRECDDVVYER